MDAYLLVKLLHVVSASVLLGTGAGIAFFMLQAYRSGNLEALRVTTANVVLADWLFTTPAVVIQLVTGLWLTARLSVPTDSVWFVAVITLFALVGACWVPVVGIQIRIRNLLRNGAGPEAFRGLMRAWMVLGIPAFLGVLALYALMVTKWGMNTLW